MKKIFYVFTIAAFVFGLCACGASDQASNQPSSQPVDAAHNSENSLDWAGVYAGVIPAASGPGINATITLRNDLTYEVQYQYIDRPDGDFTFAGNFRWNDAGNTITLDATNVPPHYRVVEGRLIQLDMEGNPITGALADEYVLTKR